jgi:two-component system, NarL family, sensor histidine kinase DesK
MWEAFWNGSPSRWQATSGVIYAAFVFLVPAIKGAPWTTWVITAASFAIFAALYRDFFVHPAGPKGRQLADLAGIGLLGSALLPINTGGTTYVVYVAALVPFVLKPSHAIAVFVLAAAVLWAVMMTLVASLDRYIVSAWVTGVIFIVGIGNIFVGERVRQGALLRQAREDVEEMAKLAERERIARDLHDLLGHTLSVIALKSELASKLADRDPARAAAEIRDVERVSREALSEVRAAVEGYKGRGFSGELHGAQRTLGSAGVRLDASVATVTLSPRQETVLALALRETITNVVRHARASMCRVALGVERGELVLTIQDDGVGGPVMEGNGLIGMRERVRAAGGTLVVDAASGVRVCVRLPVDSLRSRPVAVATT